MTTIAEARVKKQELAWARGQDQDKANLMDIVVAFGQRLTSRMSQVETNGALVNKRRQQWSREEYRAKLDREAAWLEMGAGEQHSE